MHRLVIVLLACFALAWSALAQQDDSVRAQLETFKTTLDRIEQSLQGPGLDQSTLQTLRDDIDPMGEQLRQLTARIEPDVRGIEERLKQLGDAPEAPATEEPAIAAERKDLQQRFSAADADLRQSRLLTVRTGQLSERIADRRRELLNRELFNRSASILDPTLWRDVGNAMPRLGMGLGFFVQDWFSVLGRSANALGFVVLAFSVLLAVALYWPLRQWLLGLPFGGARAWGSVERPTAVQRSMVAAWTAVLNAFLPALAAYLVVFVLTSLDLIPFRFGQVANAVVFAMVIYSALTAVASALLAPNRPAWRFLPVSDAVARRAMRTAVGMGLVAAVFHVLQQIAAVVYSPLAITVVLLGLRSVSFAAVLAVGLTAIARIESAEREARAKDPYAGPVPKAAAWRWTRLLLWVVALAVGGAGLYGYAAFGAYLSSQVVWALVVAGALVMLARLIDDVAMELTRTGTAGSRRVAATLGLEQSSVEQIGIIVSGLLRVIAIVLAGFILIAPWGVESRDALGWMRAMFFGIQIGNLTISISAILLGVAVFVAGLLATRSVQRWLDEKLLPSTRLDIGLRNSIRTGFGYVGFIAASLIGFSYLGVDVQNLAIVAGALSVGIGFGLQSIVSNFVSGLILLAERPVKAGDWIVVGDAEGYVRRINVRSTEIETFDKAVVILPNSSLVSGTVRNWMHNGLFGRARVRVSVPHGTDAAQVQGILLEIARAHPLVTLDPEPRAALIDFTDATLVFELGFTVSNVDKSFGAKSDIRYQIVKRFADAGIGIGTFKPDPDLAAMQAIEPAPPAPPTASAA